MSGQDQHQDHATENPEEIIKTHEADMAAVEIDEFDSPADEPVHQTHAMDSHARERWEHDEWEGEWEEPSNLSAPEPRPGMVQRWCRYEMLGTADAGNISKKRRQGWVPRKLDSVPEGWSAPTMRHGPAAGYICVQGLVLCEMPRSKWQSRERKMAEKLDRQREAVSVDLRDANESGIGSAGYGQIRREHKTQVQTGAGARVPVVQGDQ